MGFFFPARWTLLGTRLPKRSRRLAPRPARKGSAWLPKFRPQVEELEARALLSGTDPFSDIPVAGRNVNLGHLPGNQVEATVAINPTNPDNLVAFSNDLSVSAGIREYVSNDGGKSWTNRLIGAGD